MKLSSILLKSWRKRVSLLKPKGKKKMLPFSVCVDLDGTLISHWTGDFHIKNFGHPLPGAREFLEQLRAMGGSITIFTCRGNANLSQRDGYGAAACQQIIKDYLDANGLIYDSVYVGQGKPVANWYIDDRGISCMPEYDADAYTRALMHIRSMSED